MLRARCSYCAWIWDVVALPMPVTPAAKAMKAACCPMCGEASGHTVAPSRELTEAQEAQKRKLDVAEASTQEGAGASAAPPEPGHAERGTAGVRP